MLNLPEPWQTAGGPGKSPLKLSLLPGTLLLLAALELRRACRVVLAVLREAGTGVRCHGVVSSPFFVSFTTPGLCAPDRWGTGALVVTTHPP